jgi:ornithine racemase
MQEKPLLPTGILAPTPQGEVKELDEKLIGKSSFRAIVDVGILDVDPKYLIAKDENIEILGASSDMIIINLGQNPLGYKVGDILTFDLKYMGALGLLNSDYVDKKIVD